MNFDINNIGLNFDNSFLSLSKILMTEINPTPVKSPKLITFNDDLAKDLDLNFKKIDKSVIALFLSGNKLPNGSKSIAQAYAGHQFGYFTMLGDGRATLIGEHITSKKERFDIQLKGSGRTPYSRNGDGRATLTSMLREYLISESMHNLGISTTRSLSVVSTGENVQREKYLMGGILTRIASSHIRVGTFQYLSMKNDLKTLKKLINYCLNRHYTNIPIEINSAITLLKLVRNAQISLIVDWMRVGFIHGVLNSDNMLVSGETIDYGPCAFMDTYNPQTVFSSIDLNGRYSFMNQSIMAHWNISRFAETLIPFLNKSENKAIEIGREIINEFEGIFKNKWLKMMKNKLGFVNDEKNDYNLIQDLLNWMKNNKADYTNTFIHLMDSKKIVNKVYENESFRKIKNKINSRKTLNKLSKKLSTIIMNSNNPLIIPRNHIVEKALQSINEYQDYTLFNDLLEITKSPYTEKPNIKYFQKTPNDLFEKKYKTFCGT